MGWNVRLAAAIFTGIVLAAPGVAQSRDRASDTVCEPRPPVGKNEVRVRFMGVSTLLIEDSRTQLLLDGFFSRPNPLAVMFGDLKPNLARIEEGLCRGGVKDPAAVLAAHAHYDHAMDSAQIVAIGTGRLIGSDSVLNIGRGHGLAESRLEEVSGRQSWWIGCFRVTAIPSMHASPDRWEGTIARPLTSPAKVNQYRNGGDFSYLVEQGGVKILVVPSAGSRPGLYNDAPADTVYLGIGGLGVKDAEATEALWREAVERVGASRVYLIHWDNFTRSLRRRLSPTPWPFDNVQKTRRRIDQLAQSGRREIEVRRPEAFESAVFAMQAHDDSQCAALDPRRVVPTEPPPSNRHYNQ